MSSSPALTPDLIKQVALKQALRRAFAQVAALPQDWAKWHQQICPTYLYPPYASYHQAFWDWAWSIAAFQPSRPFVAVWPRGFAKSTSAEVASAAMAARATRSYGLYICDTQDQADKHVANVAGILESGRFSQSYPKVASRKISRYGTSQGWRRNRLRTSSGFTLDGIGIDTAARGAKVDEDRPDWIILDDLDDLLDSPGTTRKKIEILTKSLLPAGASYAATLVIQNLVHPDGVVAQLVDGRADFLHNRIISGPHPALEGAAFQAQEDGTWVITEGTPTWPAIGLPHLQQLLDQMGISAFRAEEQHEVDLLEGGLFSHISFQHCGWADLPPLRRVVVWVDPAVTDTDQSDSHGIQADGISDAGVVYRLFSWEARTSPEDSLRRATLKAHELGAEAVGVETDQGGDTWRPLFKQGLAQLQEAGAIPQEARIHFREAKAGARGGKSQRASQMLTAYERGQIIHVTGTHETLERALRRYLLRKPFDLVDAAFWAWDDLANRPQFKVW